MCDYQLGQELSKVMVDAAVNSNCQMGDSRCISDGHSDPCVDDGQNGIGKLLHVRSRIPVVPICVSAQPNDDLSNKLDHRLPVDLRMQLKCSVNNLIDVDRELAPLFADERNDVAFNMFHSVSSRRSKFRRVHKC